MAQIMIQIELVLCKSVNVVTLLVKAQHHSFL